jgi:Bacterial alpha-L-rhamnosidase 6 hairpin glycosidase domain
MRKVSSVWIDFLSKILSHLLACCLGIAPTAIANSRTTGLRCHRLRANWVPSAFLLGMVASVAAAMLTLLGCSKPTLLPFPDASASGDNLSPSSRTLSPIAITKIHGQVTSPDAVLSGGVTALHGQGSYLVIDFGKEVGGIVSLQFADASDGSQSMAMAFSESSLYIGLASDLSSGGSKPDGYLSLRVTPHATYIMPADQLRGGFRYLTLGMTTGGSVELTGVSLAFTPAPALSDLRAYMGSFQSNDATLNRIWYAGAYTVQMDTIDPNQGRVWPAHSPGWLNNGPSGSGSTILTDGAKRDRQIWPGDLGISATTAYVSTGDTISVKNNLDTLFAMQDPAGGLSYVGPEMSWGTISDTYHLWTLDAVLDYYLYSGDRDWLRVHWSQFQHGIQFSTAKIDARGLLSVNLTEDWGRQSPGGEEISANALLYHVLRGASFLASVVGDSTSAAAYDSQASSLRAAIQALLWNSAAGMYRDVPGSSLYPQDGNALALWFGVPDSASDGAKISANLRRRWNNFGAMTPERPGGIATFPGSMEVLAHFAAGEDTNALDLIRLEWGYMLTSPTGTGSTFWEGYRRDGSFDYGGRYMSLAHGWATGPTTALTQFVAGVGPELSLSVPFHFIPHLGDLSQASATVPLAQGAVAVSWSYSQGTFVGNVIAPESLAGRYGVPINSGAASVLVDGKMVWNSCTNATATGFGQISRDGNYVFLSSVTGSHAVMAKSTCSP